MVLENYTFQEVYQIYQEALVSINTFLSVWKYEFYINNFTRLGKREQVKILQWPNKQIYSENQKMSRLYNNI